VPSTLSPPSLEKEDDSIKKVSINGGSEPFSVVRENIQDLRLQFRRDLLVSVYIENPVRGTLFKRKSFLPHVALPVLMSNLVGEFPANLKGLICGA
jgi:hypothetical protein